MGGFCRAPANNAVAGMALFVPDPAILAGFTAAAALVILKFLCSAGRKETCKVGILWKH